MEKQKKAEEVDVHSTDNITRDTIDHLQAGFFISHRYYRN